MRACAMLSTLLDGATVAENESGSKSELQTSEIIRRPTAVKRSTATS
jgi:hypothetical protein